MNSDYSPRNSSSSNNQRPQTVEDYIQLLMAVKEKYGNLRVRYANDKGEAACDGCHYEFDDIVILNPVQSLIRDDVDNKATLVFITD